MIVERACGLQSFSGLLEPACHCLAVPQDSKCQHGELRIVLAGSRVAHFLGDHESRTDVLAHMIDGPNPVAGEHEQLRIAGLPCEGIRSCVEELGLFMSVAKSDE